MFTFSLANNLVSMHLSYEEKLQHTFDFLSKHNTIANIIMKITFIFFYEIEV